MLATAYCAMLSILGHLVSRCLAPARLVSVAMVDAWSQRAVYMGPWLSLVCRLHGSMLLFAIVLLVAEEQTAQASVGAANDSACPPRDGALVYELPRDTGYPAPLERETDSRLGLSQARLACM